MKSIYSLLTAGAAATILFLSCKKDDSGGPSNGGNTGNLSTIEKLIIGKWGVESKTQERTDASGNVTRTNILDNCEKDDTYTFAENKTYTVDSGTASCTYLMGYGTTCPWSVSKTDSTFQFTQGPGLSTYPHLDLVNQTTLQISARYASSLPPYTKDIYVYKRK